MKKEYEAPKTEKLEFDYSKTVVASGSKNGKKMPCVIAGHDLSYTDGNGNQYSQHIPGDE